MKSVQDPHGQIENDETPEYTKQTKLLQFPTICQKC